MPWAPDQAVVISLVRRPDRRAAQGNVVANLGFDAPYSWAVDGASTPAPPHWASSPESYANMLSHKAVLESFQGGTIMVLEDDAVIGPDFRSRMSAFLAAVPAAWEALWLGGQHLRFGTTVRPGVVRTRYTIRTHAYVMREPAVRMALAVMQEAIMHWDNTLALRLGQRQRTYAPDPFIVGITNLAGDIPDSTTLS